MHNAQIAGTALKYSYGIVILLAGLDKMLGTNLIVSWPKYVSAFVEGMLPVSVGSFIVIIGIIEVAVALMMLTKYTRLAAYISIAWLLLISINLLMGGYVDVAIRDILLAVGAFALAKLQSEDMAATR